MDAVLLSWLFMLGLITTHIIFLTLLVKTKDKAGVKTTTEAKVAHTKRLEAQVSALEEELKKTKTNYLTLQDEIQVLNKEKSDLKEEMLKYKRSHIATDIQLERLKKENTDISNKLINKEKELERLVSLSSTQEKEIKGKKERLEILQKNDEEKTTKLQDLEARIKELNKEIEARDNIITEYKNKDTQYLKATKKEEVEIDKKLEITLEQKKQKIGEILLAHNFITKEILDKALEYQKTTNCNIAQYLLANGYIKQEQLAQCLCTQFGIPYLPLSSYNISDEMIGLVPVEIAQKYWLIPIEKLGNFLTVVMADPLDTKAIKEVEQVTGCKVRPFVGILSEIIDALEGYYKVEVKDKELRIGRTLPLFIDTQSYKGPERRRSVRYNAKIDIHFAVENHYKKSKTKDVSQDGFFFESDIALTIGSLLTIQVDLPKEFSPLPIAAIVQVARIVPQDDEKFGIGVKLIKISRQELDTIIKYSSTHEESNLQTRIGTG